MFEHSIRDAREAVTTALADLRADASRTTGQGLIDHLTYLNTLRRQIEHDTLHTIARLNTEGEFERRAARPAAAIADLLRAAPAHARRLVRTATAVFTTSLTGEALEPKLPATATALAGYEIDQAHAEVIDRALNTSAAHRIGVERWTGVEAQLADWARTYPPDQLAHLAHALIDRLDADGPQPGEEIGRASCRERV